MKNFYKDAMERFSSFANENRHFCESQARMLSAKGHEPLAARSKAQALVWRTMEEYIEFELDDIKERLKSEEIKDDQTN